MASSDSIDWDNILKSSRRNLGRFPSALPQRVTTSLSFDTPKESSDIRRRRDLSSLKPFDCRSIVEEDDKQVGQNCFSRVTPSDGPPFERSQTEDGRNSQLDLPCKDPDGSRSPSPPNLKTVNYQTNTRIVLSTQNRSRHRSESPSHQIASRHRSTSSPSLSRVQSHVSDRQQVQSNPKTLSTLWERGRQLERSSTEPFALKQKICINGLYYQIVDKIGKGGSSEVFRVLDENNIIKAVKKVDLSDVGTQEADCFRKEVQLLMRLRDKRRIVHIFDFAEVTIEGSNILLVVMEHGEKDLSNLLKEYATPNNVNRNILTDTKIKFYWEEMLEAVQEIHREGIVHSDLKPANFLIVGGMVKLIDFGIASSMEKDRTHVTKANPFGTLNFMSPESILCQDENSKTVRVGVKSDVWSLGCILYNMVYGKLPFSHIGNPFQKYQAIVNPQHSIDFPRVAENHDPLVIDVLKICLVRDPVHRASIAELLSHPYLKTSSKKAQESDNCLLDSSAGQPRVDDVLSAFSSLTPNSKRMFVEKIVQSGK